MSTRSHRHEEEFAVTPERMFALLHTPSAIRQWWSAARAIVIAKPGGIWSAAWGEREDEPDYVSSATMSVFDPPRRIAFSDFKYFAKSGPLPFEMNATTSFTVEPRLGGCLLRVEQDGLPTDPAADAFYRACEVGWKNTFVGIRKYLAR